MKAQAMESSSTRLETSSQLLERASLKERNRGAVLTPASDSERLFETVSIHIQIEGVVIKSDLKTSKLSVSDDCSMPG